jgi:predicted PurR-regulated permease PerM
MAADRIAEFFAEKTARRALALVLFVGLIVTFRHLAVLLVFFVSFERGLFFSAGFLSRRFKWKRLQSLALVLTVGAVAVGLLGWVSAGRLAKLVVETRETLPERMATLRQHPWYVELQSHLPDSEDLAQSAEHYAADVAKSAAAIGRMFLSALIGLILAIVYFLDEERIRAFREGLSSKTLFGTLVRWFEHLAESVSLTVQLQLVVAACNAVLTLPVLLLIGVPHVPALMVLIFVSGLIPVVGNLISGAVLVVLAYQVKGWLGVSLFVGLTFVLHKIESYYLNPRLTARHVALPGFVLILSLLAWEHLLGFAGLFVSFPFLYLVGKIRSEFLAEDEPPAEDAPPA